MTKKIITIKFNDGTVYSIPATFVANMIAEYYCKKEDTDYYEEFNNAYNDDFLLTDWLSNNCNWSDVNHITKVLKVASLDYEDEWPNAEKEVM